MGRPADAESSTRCAQRAHVPRATPLPMARPELTPPPRDAEHEARALGAITRALKQTPFYVEGAKPRPIPEAGVALDDALSKLPLLFKRDIRATLPKHWVPAGRDAKAELLSGDIELVETSGSTAERTRILWDKGWWLKQEERAFCTHPRVARALSGADRAYREAILTTPVCGLGTCHTSELTFEERRDDFRLFLNMRADPTFWNHEDVTRILDELARHETVGLESDPMYLAVLARHAAAMGRRIEVSDFIVLTYGFASQSHVRAIRGAYAGVLLQLYGASEVGVLFMEGEDGLLHHCPLTTHVELLPIKVPTPGSRDVCLAVVTTLDRTVQPLVRFVVGDLVQVDRSAPPRFTTVPPLATVEGRVHDALVLPNGGIVTAGAVDRALSAIEGIAFYQVNQSSASAVEIDVVPERGASIEASVRGKIAPLCEGLAISVRATTAIAAEPSGKFRTARRHVSLDLGTLFDGCAGVSL